MLSWLFVEFISANLNGCSLPSEQRLTYSRDFLLWFAHQHNHVGPTDMIPQEI